MSELKVGTVFSVSLDLIASFAPLLALLLGLNAGLRIVNRLLQLAYRYDGPSHTIVLPAESEPEPPHVWREPIALLPAPDPNTWIDFDPKDEDDE